MISNIMSTITSIFKTFQFKDAVDIIVIAFIIYYLFRLIRQTRAGQLVKGVIILLIAYGISAIFDLTMVHFILRALFEFAVIIIVVLFQPELRKALEKLGRSKVYSKTIKTIVTSNNDDDADVLTKAISDVCDSAVVFSHTKTGALILFERESLLTEIANTGTYLNSDTSTALLGNIFFNKAPLHDGACIIREGKILSAGCILPLSDNTNISDSLGTRHRAALGVSEETDCVAIVVSEETGVISIALGGTFIRDFNRETLYNKLTELLLPSDNEKPDLLSVLFKNRKERNDEK
ncbi:MAG: diadenylate cyclase CdaA [Oscillospiraceae bacterium]|nr:diadenylate cyclase CdaA [Candidatus Ruminococcus equi]